MGKKDEGKTWLLYVCQCKCSARMTVQLGILESSLQYLADSQTQLGPYINYDELDKVN